MPIKGCNLVADGVGNRIRVLRKQRGWTAVELSHQSGVSRQAIAKIENGIQTDIRLSYAMKLATALSVSLDVLADMSLPDEAVIAAYEFAAAKQKLNTVLTEYVKTKI